MTAPLIELKDVVKRFGNRLILDGVNLQIHEGQVTTLIGKSGTGKSVLLKHIIGLLSPDSGQILFRGRPMEGAAAEEARDQISYMFQNNALFDSLTVYENIAFPLREHTDLPDDVVLAGMAGGIFRGISGIGARQGHLSPLYRISRFPKQSTRAIP